jgi:hypothetical protein
VHITINGKNQAARHAMLNIKESIDMQTYIILLEILINNLTLAKLFLTYTGI